MNIKMSPTSLSPNNLQDIESKSWIGSDLVLFSSVKISLTAPRTSLRALLFIYQKFSKWFHSTNFNYSDKRQFLSVDYRSFWSTAVFHGSLPKMLIPRIFMILFKLNQNAKVVISKPSSFRTDNTNWWSSESQNLSNFRAQFGKALF